jgi:hypothetical protein
MPTVVSVIGVTVGLLSLTWGICWAVWSYRRLHKPRLTVVPAPLILFGGEDVTFKPKGFRKRVKVKGLQQRCVGVRVYNIGPTAVTIDHLEAFQYQTGKSFLRRIKLKHLPLLNCWLAVQEDEFLPKVLKPGDMWSGLCDYSWLTTNLKITSGQAVWHLGVRVCDTLGRAYQGFAVVTEQDFNHILNQHLEDEEEE